ncbi:cysteine hydrolase family protein [Bacteroidota bacterium]
MKEQYFTESNINKTARSLIEEIGKSVKIRKRRISGTDTALVVLDMQDYFLNEESHAFVPSAPAIIPGINKLINAFLKFPENKLPLIFTKHINSDLNAGQMAAWWKELVNENTEWGKITDNLIFPGATVVTKSQYDAFYQTDLEAILNENGIRQLIVTGVMTHLCCESTIRAAFVRGFDVLFPVDGTATYNFDFHRSSFLNISHGFATPVLIDDLLKQLE